VNPEIHHTLLDATEEALYIQWKRHGRHLAEYVSEFAGTLFLVFVVIVAVGVMFGPTSPVGTWLPNVPLRLIITGMLIGGSGWLVAISPPGRLSGAHINPAISMGFWILGRMHKRDLWWYVVFQMAGGAVGAILAKVLLPRLVQPIHLAVLKPAPGITAWTDFGLETVVTFVLATVIFSFVASTKLARYTPAAVTVSAGILNCLDGKVSGAGMNPARWFGPAFTLCVWHLGWVYVAGPIVGALLAASIRLLPRYSDILPNTAKLFHDPNYRSIFKHEAIPSTPPDSVRNARTSNTST